MPKDPLRSTPPCARNHRSSVSISGTSAPPPRLTRRLFVCAAYAGLVLVLLSMLSSMIDSPLAYAASTPHSITLKGAPSTPNTQDPTAGSTSHTRTFAVGAPGTQPPHAPVNITRNVPLPMKAGTVALQVGKAVSFVGSDGRLELLFPASAITAQDLAAAGGTITARVMQVAPASGSLAGGSGEISLGTYLVQFLDAQGHLLTHGLRQPFTARYHLQKHEVILGLDHARVVLGGSVSAAMLKAQGAVLPTASTTTNASTPTPSFASTLGPLQKQAAHLDTTARTLTATPLATTPSTSMSFESDSPIATFGKPDPTSVDLSAGALSYSEPLSLPAGPGGFTPPVNLTYSSAAVNGQHNISAAAGWVGEGWNLSLGAITWNEQNVTAGATCCPANWENTWQLSDAYGTSSELIPPNITESTFDDDTPNFYCGTGNSAAVPCPTLWHTATETHAKIEMYIGSLNIGQQITPPCFRVWLPNGIMEEFGCTLDSLQYSYEAGLGAIITGWNLDLITDPQGNQIHVTYQQDLATWISPSTGQTYTFPRDTELSSIQYDSPGCHNAQSMCTGASWAPQMQVVFNASHVPAHLTGSAPSGCNTGANMRCDDPVDLSGNNGTTTAQMQSTLVLNSIQVQVRTSGTGSWNTLRTSNLSYEQSGPGTITDPASGLQRSVAGQLDLTSIQNVGSDGTTALPTVTFGYSTLATSYLDSNYTPNPTTNCSPTWNSANGACPLWSQSRAGNNRYLSSISNGQGLAQTFTWTLAHNNTHGVNGGGANNANPFYCNSQPNTYPCDEADDEGWSLAVLTSESSTTLRLTQNGQGGQQSSTPITSTTAYSYQVTAPLTASFCSDCVAGMYWGNQNDADYLNYYNAKFMGFAQATVNRPTGAVEVHKYYAGEGWGLYDTSQVQCFPNFAGAPCHNDPWWDLANAAHGHEYQTLSYDVDGTTLLQQVNATFQAVCPPSGVSGTPAFTAWGNWDGHLVSAIDHNNPVAVCDIQQTQQTTQTYDGASNSVITTTNWTYDNFGRVTQQTTTSNGGTPSKVVKNTAYVWNDGVSATQTSASGTYLIDTPAFTDTEDGSGNRLACQYVSYDGQSYTTGQSSGLTGGLKTTTDAYADCGTSSNNFTPSADSQTTTAYDAYGNPVGTTDADANAGISGHTGCSVGSMQHTTCTTYDSAFTVFPVSAANALNQSTSTSYGNTGNLFGFGTWPSSTTDLNHQSTSYTYDALGRMTGETLPGESSGNTTTQWVYTNWCSGTAAQAPCEEIDEIDRLDSSTTITKRAFYDGEGRLIETRMPGPAGQDIVTYATYDASGRQIFKSTPYFVNAIGNFDWSKIQYVSGDFNGDGKADVLGIYDAGLETPTHSVTAIYEWLGTGSGLSYQGAIWIPSGSLTASVIKWVAGDFNGDGKTDLIGMYNLGNSSLEALEWLGSSTGLSYKGAVWQASGFDWTQAQFVAGDFNGDGKADILATYNLGLQGNGQNAIGIYEWLGTSSGVSYQNQIWNSTSVGGFTWANAKWVTGDFNGDGKADLMAMYNMGNNSMEAIEWSGASSGLTYNSQVWQASGFDWTQAQFVAGDFNGDGKADVLAMYNLGVVNGTNAIGAYEWLGTSTGVTYQNQIWNSTNNGGYSWANATWVSGDFNGDHKADTIGMYHINAPQQGLPALEATEWLGASSGITYRGIPWNSIGTDLLGAAAYSIPDSSQPGTSTTYPTLRQSSVTDPNSHTTTSTTSVICSVPGTSDTGCYVQTMVVDANGHESATLTGGLGKTSYTQRYTGTSGSFALYATTSTTYDAAGRLLSTVSPDGTTTSAIYDALGHVVSQSDPDHGLTTLSYDPNGNLTQAVDARGSAGTVFMGYDGLNRPLWHNSTNSPTGAWVSFTYDSTANGNLGVGQMTGESFTGSGGLSGAYAIAYDARGQQTQNIVTVNGTNYTTHATYNDAGMITSQTYPTGEVVTPGYDANGWLTSLNTQSGSTTTTLASNLAYMGLAGAAGHITSMDFGSGETYAASYDTGLRLTGMSLTQASNNTLVYQSQPAYDATNNVVSVQTSINGATDTQQFCYDALNRLTWSGTSGTPPCSGATFSAGTLTGAQYQQSDSYNVDGGLTSGPGGSYTYGNSSHPHALMSTSSGYSAAYDATGNLTCRAPNSSTTCNGTQTGQQLSYDAEGRLSIWQNQPTSPTQIVNYLYDGSGNRVAMMATVNGTTTLTAYLGSLEEVQTTGSTTQTTTFYTVDGQRIAAKVNSTLYYFGYDALGSQTLVLNSNGGVVGSQLYGPYGNRRYSSGTLPTSIGFTGQRADSVTGLDYYVARYYDPVVGVFLSPDRVQGNAQGMQPYAYVGGNPETRTDPTGHRFICPDCGGGGGSTPPPNPGNAGGPSGCLNCIDGPPPPSPAPPPVRVGGGGGGGTKTGAHPCVTGCAGGSHTPVDWDKARDTALGAAKQFGQFGFMLYAAGVAMAGIASLLAALGGEVAAAVNFIIGALYGISLATFIASLGLLGDQLMFVGLVGETIGGTYLSIALRAQRHDSGLLHDWTNYAVNIADEADNIVPYEQKIVGLWHSFPAVQTFDTLLQQIGNWVPAIKDYTPNVDGVHLGQVIDDNISNNMYSVWAASYDSEINTELGYPY